MPTYMVLVNATEKGIEARKSFPERIEKIKKGYSTAGVKHIAAYHTMGPYDGIHIVEAPNALAVAKLALIIESHGMAHVETRHLFTAEEYLNLVNSLP